MRILLNNVQVFVYFNAISNNKLINMHTNRILFSQICPLLGELRITFGCVDCIDKKPKAMTHRWKFNVQVLCIINLAVCHGPNRYGAIKDRMKNK